MLTEYTLAFARSSRANANSSRRRFASRERHITLASGQNKVSQSEICKMLQYKNFLAEPVM